MLLSLGPTANRSSVARNCWKKLAWVSTAPFGSPVVPDV